ncbi:MAG TPA: dihydroorotase [Thermodesulfovibrionales bacterium]|nr:dihydroorotase [Thermodesulfovibrionales bacterium]
MNLLIKNGHIIDPSQGIDGKGDLVIENNRIKEISLAQKGRRNAEGKLSWLQGFRTIDASGLHVLPGLIDIHTHMREPGFEYKETIKTGTMAAVKGGFTSVCTMPNTNPVNDNSSVTDFIIRKAIQEGECTVYPIGAITKGQRGEELAEMGIMYAEGCVAFSDDGRPVMSSLVMRRALEYSRAFNVPIISHCEDLNLSEGGVMNEGLLSVTLGLRGVPPEAEEAMVGRDIALAGLAKGRLHIAHVSTAGSVRLIREAKARGIQVTAETCPHYFSITEKEVEGYNTNAKVNPPLRRQEDVDALKEGLKDGTIDVIATDHAPHHRDEKLREFDQAPSGISGIETAIGISLRLVEHGVLTLAQLVEKMAKNPAVILGLDKGSLKPGADADITILDLNKEYGVDPGKFVSKGKNTPFEGWMLKGMPVITICKGRVHE